MTTPKRPNSACELLPPAARQILQQAAITPVPGNDPMARTRAIESATQKVRYLYPNYFTKE